MKIPAPLLTVVRHLGPVRERVVFVGGMIRGLLVTDPAASAARPTDDVDLILDVPSRHAYYKLGEELRALGFQEAMVDEDAPICRWIIDGVRADIMPIDPASWDLPTFGTTAPRVTRASPGDRTASSDIWTRLISVRPSSKPSRAEVRAISTTTIWKTSSPWSTAGQPSRLRSQRLRESYAPSFQRRSQICLAVYDGLLGAYSHGRYFNAWIRSRYRSSRLR